MTNKKVEVTYSNLTLNSGKSHQHSLHRQTHNSAMAKKSDADVDWTHSIVREANKYPNGHSGKRQAERRLKQCALTLSNRRRSTSSETEDT